MKGFFAASLAAFAATASAGDYCGQWDSTTVGKYIVYNNLWGKGDATSGSQCTGVTSSGGSNLAWHTNWSWQGGFAKVKSYANANLLFTPKQINSIKSIPSTWKWQITHSGPIVADISYDLFTSPTTSTKDNAYEIMIWLSALGGAGPISSTGSPIASVVVAGIPFKLYKGINGNTVVYSFVVHKSATNFNADLKEFFNYLVKNQKFPANQYLTTVQAGTEPFSGTNVKFTTSAYSVSVN
ncbi:xyloglucan-specific endo-beta-1,4-glucanase A [Thraustotheca clavata]|uniref:Xyloglucan-specific endo-beta-1,4-glucanase A n=1 Tax=Thraustotheca clavata TaxID=74557 RepID=A0A1V9ZAC9_9STRA|nr:xyloglucan-specific endo-beta-1,4-glucanase A [Thraustotheca clavata]